MPIAVVEQKLKTLPEEYLLMVANYIDSIMNQIEEKSLENNETYGFGLLKKYANSALVEKEKEAWAMAAGEKHGLSGR